jgi:hypothetical protein
MNEIEEKIWDFIDGNLSNAQQQEVELLIDTNESYKQKYQEIFALVQSLESMSLDEPSMSFSNKVMEKVHLINIPLSAKARVDARIINFIGSFFILSLVLILVYSFSEINWSEKSSFENPLKLSLENFSISPNIKSTFIQLFLMIDVLVALLVFDKFLRFKRESI